METLSHRVVYVIQAPMVVCYFKIKQSRASILLRVVYLYATFDILSWSHFWIVRMQKNPEKILVSQNF